MTFDCHVHVPSSRRVWELPHYPPDDYVTHMDRIEVDTSVLLPFDGLYHHSTECNDEVARWCAGHPNRLIPFGTVVPRDPGAPAEVSRCVQQLGMRGLKRHPWMQAFHPLEPVLEPIYGRCRDLGVPVLFHDGTPPLSTPLQVAQVAARFPGLVVVLGHGGLNDLYEEAIDAVRRYDNLWICMTSLHVRAMRRIVARAPRERILFGSDGGLASVERQTYVQYRWEMLRDPLGFRFSCRVAMCGTCTIRVDGRSVLACQTRVPEDADEIRIEPVAGLPVIRDLIVDTTPFWDEWSRVSPYLMPRPDLDEPARIPADAEERQVIDRSLDCIGCAACYSSCAVVASGRDFLGPAALQRALVLIADSRDAEREQRLAAVTGEDGADRCHYVYACTDACPKGLDPAAAIRKLRRWRFNAPS